MLLDGRITRKTTDGFLKHRTFKKMLMFPEVRFVEANVESAGHILSGRIIIWGFWRNFDFQRYAV